MYKKPKYQTTSITRNESVEGETIEQKVSRALNNGEGISDHAQVIYTERKDGVRPEYDIRTDKWEIAVQAMDKVTTDNQAKRRANIIKFNPETGEENGGKEGGGKGEA